MEIVYFDADVPTVLQEFAAMLLSYVGAITLLVLVSGGVYYMYAAGDATRQTTAKRIISYALLGLLIIILSYSMLKVVETIAVN